MLESPFLIEDETKAFKAYCAMPHLKRAGAKKPTKAQFKKLYATRRAEIEQGETVASAKGDDHATLMQTLAEAILSGDTDAIKEAFAAANEEPTTDDEPQDGLLEPRDTPEDAASNGVLWRLNKEGILYEALEAAEEAGLDYITQTIGTEILTRGFGPLTR